MICLARCAAFDAVHGVRAIHGVMNPTGALLAVTCGRAFRGDAVGIQTDQCMFEIQLMGRPKRVLMNLHPNRCRKLVSHTKF
jgi:hypothetical protein